MEEETQDCANTEIDENLLKQLIRSLDDIKRGRVIKIKET